MKKINKFYVFFFISLFLVACGGSEKEEKEQVKIGDYSKSTKTETKTDKQEPLVDLSNKGIGPIKSVTVPAEIDDAMAAHGEDVFNKMCTACHKMDKKFIGPKLDGITTRRAPEWIMNMIMNPEEMIQKDPIAKQLLVESNMAVMANQNINEEDTRAIYEFFRKNDQ